MSAFAEALAGLPADQAHRFRAVLEALSWSLPGGAGEILDVGGYPGSFARAAQHCFPKATISVADVYDAEMNHYAKVSGAELPFEDGKFDAVVSIDTFEHIPPGSRKEFLAELCRVSRRFVVLTAPFHHAATEEVERILDGIHRQLLGRPHPWLEEHLRFGLPKVEETAAAWPDSHGLVAVESSYDLAAWTTWQGLELAAKRHGALDREFAAFDQASAAGPVPPSAEVGYRRLFLAERGAPAVRIPPEPTPDGGRSAVALAQFLSRWLELSNKAQTDIAQADSALNGQLRAALRHAEGEVRRLRDESKPSWLRWAESKARALWKR